MNRARASTIFSPSANESDSAHTSAVYSPRLWPAMTSGVNPSCAFQARHSATPAVSKAGCVTSVLDSRSAGPSLQTCQRS